MTINLAYVLDPDFSEDHDIDLYLFSGSGPAFSGAQLVAKSANVAGAPESIRFVAPAPGTYSLVVLGWLIVRDQPFVLGGTPVTFGGQDYRLHTFGL